MNENTILKNFSKKAKFLLLYILILIMVLFVIIIFTYINLNTSKSNIDSDTSLDSNLSTDLNIIDTNYTEPELEIVYAGDPEDCGNNFNCFKRYSGDCKSNSRFVFEEKIETEDRIFTRVTEYKIFGVEYIYCKVNFKVSDVNVEYKDSYVNTLKQEGMDDLNISSTLSLESNLIREDIGKTGYCYYNTPQELINYLDKLETNTLTGGVSCFIIEDGSEVCSSSGDMVNNSCGGDYFFIDYK